MIELTRNRRGQFRHSAYHNWRKKKNRVWSDYQPYAVAIFGLITWLVLTQILPVYAHIQNETGYVEILSTYREPLKIPVYAAKTEGNHDEPVSADSESLPQDSSDGGKDATPTPSSEVEAKILKAWEGTSDGPIAVAVAKSESGLNPNAKGDVPLEYWYEGKKIGHSCGIFQIRVLPGRPDCETLKNVDKNIEFARKLYDTKLQNGEKQKFLPWSNWKNNRFMKFL